MLARERGEQRRQKIRGDGGDNANANRAADRSLSLENVAARGFELAKDGAMRFDGNEGKAPNADVWRRVKPFPNASGTRVRYLTEAEASRLLNACALDFRDIVRAGLETGARYSELGRLRVEDFNPDTGTLAIRESKSGKPRHIVLTNEGRAFFEQICAGRGCNDVMLPRANGAPWGTSHQLRPIAEACKRARISPPITFHELRHTWASLAVMNGVPLLVAAKNLGHADTRMIEKHYGHLAQSYITDEIRKGGPQFGAVEPTNVQFLK